MCEVVQFILGPYLVVLCLTVAIATHIVNGIISL